MTQSARSAQNQRLRDLLIEARNKTGLTQRELAKLLKRPQSFISKYERGERRLDLIELLEVAKALKIDVPIILRDLESARG
jgi:transcriptional regulator with XRE-family HTH domain